MLQLNKEAKKLLQDFRRWEPRSHWTDDQSAKYEKIKRLYGRLLSILLYVNQDVIAADLITPEEKDDLNSAISRIHESLFWTEKAIGVLEADPEYDLEWVLINEYQSDGCGILSESYKLVASRLVNECHHSLVLQNALVRLMNSFYLGGSVYDSMIARMRKVHKEQGEMIAQLEKPSIITRQVISESEQGIKTKSKRKRAPVGFAHSIIKSNRERFLRPIKRIINAKADH